MEPPSSPEKSRLERLFSGVSEFVAKNDLASALRLADSASRFAPDDLHCTLVHARLLIALGLAHEALQRLAAHRQPEAMVERAFAFHLLRDSASVEICASLLADFALHSVERLDALAATLCREGGCFAGWVGVNEALQLVGEASCENPLVLTLNDTVLPPPAIHPQDSGLCSFLTEPLALCSGSISIAAGDHKILGSPLVWPPRFRFTGWVMPDRHGIRGSLRMDWASDLPITLGLQSTERAYASRTIFPSAAAAQTTASVEAASEVRDAEDALPGLAAWSVRDLPKGIRSAYAFRTPAETPFLLDLGMDGVASAPLHVFAILPDGSRSELIGSPVVWPPVTLPNAKTDTVARPPVSDLQAPPSERVDIVVPVYAGYEDTLSCLNSILATVAAPEAELVVIDDASPDARLRAALKELAQSGRLTLLTNNTNLGFPGAVNAGMRLHAGRDVVLVNADTELAGDWLRRLQTAAYSSVDIGTVTPLGESASIVTYPGYEGDACTTETARQIDCIAREVNAGATVDLPVGVGFCFYIKRACLNATGVFDEWTFGRGYGEENDFCLRAGRLGWRHVAAPNVFVRHRGARSFGRLKTALIERNGQVLNTLHPGYDEKVATFSAADPLRPARRAIDVERLLVSAASPVLLVTCSLRGGVQRHVDTRRGELTAQGHSVVVLQPDTMDLPAKEIRLRAPDQSLVNLHFTFPAELGVLRGLLQRLRLEKIEFHHFAGLPAAALHLAAELGVRYEVFIHDYAWICPRLTLSNGDGGYCGEPAVDDCERCIRRYGTFLDLELSVRELRERSARILHSAERVVVPTHDVRKRLARYFPERAVEVAGWEKLPVLRARPRAATAPGKLRVAVLGAISIAKGFQVLLECALDSGRRNLGIEFIVIGFTCDDEKLLATGCAFVTGRYSEDEVDALFAREKCHVAFFSSIVPETWCYALTRALMQGLPLLAFDLGSIPERLTGYGAAQLLPLTSSASAINDALRGLAQNACAYSITEEMVSDPSSSASAPPAASELQTSIQFLTLPAGTYTITVKGGATDAPANGQMVWPAVQVGVTPAKSNGVIEFLARGGTTDRWLVRSRDMIVARITGGDALLMLTSVSLPSSPELGINIRRLDPESMFADTEAAPVLESNHGPSTRIPAQVVAHIHRVGDVPFNDGLAGCLGDRLWIEAFAVGPFGSLPADQIEYCGLTADGFQTPWLDNQTLCGSRGRAIPMVGCAVRLKPAFSSQYDCAYTGQFVSGRVLGPFRNGDLCCSDIPGDPLWGIELFAEERLQNGGAPS